ncbi:T9SS type A sorting domain-containing protein [candidate division KSB1 bacterium]|nr:T9SS type A sorting domain-containing protein [candidate division KSB1 bacterium]
MFTPQKKKFSKSIFFSLLFLVVVSNIVAQGQEIIFQDDFESGWGRWYATNGVWDIGKATVGPDMAHSGQNVAGTILNGNYPPNANTRLVSQSILLPGIYYHEKLLLYVWQWFCLNKGDYLGNDLGSIQISVDDGKNWINLHTGISGYSNIWTQLCLDVTQFSALQIRIAFNFVSTLRAEDRGWYLDDIMLKKVPSPLYTLKNPEDFESGAGNWSASNGVWEVGKPTSGLPVAPSGEYCAGTILSGSYPPYADTWLMSPEIKLIPKPGQKPELFFWHWYEMIKDAFGETAQGYVMLSVNGHWKSNPIAGPYSGSSTTWTQGYTNLSTCIDSTIRIAFAFYSKSNVKALGWYIDDIRIEGVVCKSDVNFDGKINEIDIDTIVDIYLGKYQPTSTEFWAADYNDDGEINIIDVMAAINSFMNHAGIAIIAPNGGEEWSVNVTQLIQWDPSIVASKVRIEISTDAGSNWHSITDSTENDGAYTWTPSADFISENCRMKITSIKYPRSDESDNNFTISSAPESDVDFTFDFPAIGWYLISLPITPPDNSLKKLFPDALGAFAYENNAYISVSQLTPGKGYWLLVSRPMRVVITGLPFQQYTVSYLLGWSLIGSVLDTVSFSNPNDNPDGSIIVCYQWAKNTSSYRLVFPNGTEKLFPGEGYWIAAMQPGTLTLGYLDFQLPDPIAATAEFLVQPGELPPLPPDFCNVLETTALPIEKLALQNFPNPFNATTKIVYSLPKGGLTRILIYNALGQLVKTLLNSSQPKGMHQLFWEGNDENGLPVGNGLYFCRIEHLGEVQIQKMVVLK